MKAAVSLGTAWVWGMIWTSTSMDLCESMKRFASSSWNAWLVTANGHAKVTFVRPCARAGRRRGGDSARDGPQEATAAHAIGHGPTLPLDGQRRSTAAPSTSPV